MTAATTSVYRTSLAWMWIVWAGCWWLSSRWAKADQRRESAASRATHIVPLMVAAFLISQPPLQLAFLSMRVVPKSTLAAGMATAIVAVGLLFAVWACGRWCARRCAVARARESRHALAR